MPTIFVDGQPYQVREGRNLLEAVLDNDLELEYFCWHPAMPAVGSCRLCTVTQYRGENDTEGRLIVACMTPAQDGMRISITDERSRRYRRAVIEWLMINHPHDCPICDEGGECHLQDMTVMAGHVHRRYRGRKRTYENQDLGPFVHHEMNRCIQCYRCVRFYQDFAGGHDLQAMASKNIVYFGRVEDGALESEFSGNLVEVCPTGVFTDKMLKRHYTRKWDLETAPSVCVHCGVGCNTIPGARYGTLRRISARFNREVNGYFLCDRGRFGYEFVNAQSRVRTPRVREGDGFREAPWQEAWQGTIERLGAATGVYAIGSPRAPLESNYAVRRLVGAERFCPGLSDEQTALAEDYVTLLRSGPFRTPTLHEMESADAVLMLGADPINEAPMVGLALQQARRRAGADIFGAFVALTKLDEICRETYRGSPAQIAGLARQVAAALRGERAEATADRIAQSLRQAEQPLIIVGAHCGAPTLLRLATNIAGQASSAEQPAWLSLLLPECNSMGVALMGGLRVSQVLTAVERGDCDTLIVLENDLFRRTANHERLSRLLSRLRTLIVLDHLPTRTAERADWLLPTPTFAETNGTLLSAEGRAQRFYQVHLPAWDLLPVWALCRDWVSEQRPEDPAASWESYDDCLRALAEEMPAFAPALEAAPPSGFRMVRRRIPRLSERCSGRTAMRERAEARIHERPPDDPETPFAYSMEGAAEQPPAALVARVWAPGWNSNEAINKFQIEVNGPLHGGDPGKRLIAPAGGPAAQQPRDDSGAHRDAPLQVVPLARIFGSDETSRSAARLATLIAQPFAIVHPDDRGLLGEAQDGSVEVPVDGRTLRLRLVEDAGVARGVVLVPFGFPETAGLDGPANVTARSGER